MNRMKLSLPHALLTTSLLTVFLLSFAGAQSPEAKVETRDRVLKISTTSNEPLEIFNLKVGSQPIIFGEKFRAGGEWVKELSFEVRNVSDRTITYFEFGIFIPSSKPHTAGGTVQMFSYGANTTYPDVPPTTRLAPGDTVHVTYSDEYYNFFQSMSRDLELSVVTEIILRMDRAMIDDDTLWGSGKSWRRNPSNPVAWVALEGENVSPKPSDDPILSLPLVDMAAAKRKIARLSKEGIAINSSLIDDSAMASALVKITQQKDSPVLISLTEIFARNPLKPQISLKVENICRHDIRAIAIRYEVITEKGAQGGPVFGDLYYPFVIMKPGQWQSGIFSPPELTEPIKQISFSIDFVEFDDGTNWGDGSLKYTDWLAGRRAGMAAERELLLKLFATDGLRAVLQEFQKTPYEPVLPAGQSPEWSEKFRAGAIEWRAMLRRAHKIGGDSALVTALQKPLTDRTQLLVIALEVITIPTTSTTMRLKENIVRIKLTIALLLIAICAVAIPAQNKNDKNPINQLTKAEKASGWKLLFDGATLNGWRGFHSDKVPAGWAVEDGCIKKFQAEGELGRAGGDLITVDQFDNFEFSVEWKLSKGGNSGIKYLISESLPPTGRSGVSFEYQVLDDENHADAKAGIAGNRTAGSLYDLIPARNAKDQTRRRIQSDANHCQRQSHRALAEWREGGRIRARRRKVETTHRREQVQNHEGIRRNRQRPHPVTGSRRRRLVSQYQGSRAQVIVISTQ